MADSGIYDSDTEVSSVASSDSDSEQESLLDTASSADAHSLRRGEQAQDDWEQDSTALEAAKAIEAASDDNSPGAATEESASSPYVAPRRSSVSEWAEDEPAPILDGGPAPPDYGAATAWRRGGQVEEQRWQDQLTEPPSSDNSRMWAIWRRFSEKRKWRRIIRWSWIPLCLVWVATTLGLIIGQVAQNREVRRWRWRTIMSDHTLFPAIYEQNPETVHTRTTNCPFDSYSEFKSVDFHDSTNFTFVDTIDLGEQLSLRSVSGKVWVRPAPYSQHVPIQVWINTATSKPWIMESPGFSKHRNGLELQMPEMKKDIAPWTGDRQLNGDQACLGIWVGIYVREGMQNFEVRTANLDVDIGAGHEPIGVPYWPFRVREKAHISAGRGNITVQSLNSRSMHFETDSGSIGETPGPSQPLRGCELQMSEDLTMISNSGNITARIQAELIHGSYSISQQGPADQVTLSEERNRSMRKLTTSTKTGQTRLEVWTSKFSSSWPLEAHHSSTSGSMYVDYESFCLWQGDIDIKTVNGTIALQSLDGKEMKVLSDYHADKYGKHVRAKRGTGHSRWNITTQSGDVEVHLDDFGPQSCGTA